MKEGPAPVSSAETREMYKERIADVAYVPRSNLQYPAPVALSQSTRNDGSCPPHQPSRDDFLNPTLNGDNHTRYSPQRTPLSASTSTSPGRRGSSNQSQHNERHDNSPAFSMSDQRRLRQQNHHVRSNNQTPYDPEKGSHAMHSPPNGHRSGHSHSTYASEEVEDVKEHTVWILVYLSFFSPVVAALISIYTLFTVLLLLLLSPITVLVRTRKPLAHQIYILLTPPIYHQLRLVCSTYQFDSNGDKTGSEQHHIANNKGNPILLILINILGPVYAAAIAVTAWVAAGFWFTALILGDPDGRDKKDDGRTVVLGVRRLWERWLVRGLR
ncbi:MAG: hypothetical protein Q9213_004450 [Squamulea squamosa]